MIPVPSVGIDKQYVRTGAGKIRRSLWRITVNGYLLPDRGSPDETGTFWTTSGYPPDTSFPITEDNRLAVLRNKKAALQNLFSTKGMFFEIVPYDGSSPIKCVPRVVDIVFSDESNWVKWVKYTITLEADSIIFGNVSQTAEETGNNDAQETWQIESVDDKQRIFKVTHVVSAQANDQYAFNGSGSLEYAGWELARLRASSLVGYDPFAAQDYFLGDISSYNVCNHALQEAIDEGEGRYTLTETWMLVPGGTYIEDYNITTKYGVSDGTTTVSIEGSVTGASTTDFFGDRYTNAEAGWAAVQAVLYTRAITVSGVTLNVTPFNYSIGKNPLSGVITYSYEYNTRFNGQISGALTESIQVNDSLPADIFAIHRVVARPSGPIIQDILTNTEQRRTLIISAGMPPATPTVLASVPSSVQIANIITAYTPVANEQGPYVERNEVNFDYYTGRYSRTISWVYV